MVWLYGRYIRMYGLAIGGIYGYTGDVVMTGSANPSSFQSVTGLFEHGVWRPYRCPLPLAPLSLAPLC